AARAMALFILGLPGSTYIYNGQELGLPNGQMADSDRQDPIFFRTNGAQKGRDGARVPIPWSGELAPFNFSTGKPWLPIQQSWQEFTVERELADPGSSLNLYRTALKLRRKEFVSAGELTWSNRDGILSYRRGRIEVVLNTTDQPIAITQELLLSSQQDSGVIPPNAAAWLLL
ncbi:MAG: ABC transporter permease, partial [Candidatus Nanopelagicaceae bacterium]